MVSITPTTAYLPRHSQLQLHSSMQYADDGSQYDAYYGNGDPTAGLRVPQNYPGMEAGWLSWTKHHAGQILAAVVLIAGAGGGYFAFKGRKGGEETVKKSTSPISNTSSQSNYDKRTWDGSKTIDSARNFLFRGGSWPIESEREYRQKLNRMNSSSIKLELSQLNTELIKVKKELHNTFWTFKLFGSSSLWGKEITCLRQERNIIQRKISQCLKASKQK